jgi:hypothetical protein
MITRMLLTVLRVYAYYLSCNITLPPTPRSSKWLFPSGLPTKTLYAPLLSHIRATCTAHLSLLYFITREPSSPRPQVLTYTSSEKLSVYEFQRCYKSHILSKNPSLLPYFIYLDRRMNSVSLLWAGRKLESCRWQTGTKQKFLLYFCTNYTA